MSEDDANNDLPDLPPVPQVPSNPEPPPEQPAPEQSAPADEADVDPNNPVARRLREMREEKARQAAAAEEAAKNPAASDEDGPEVAAEPDPDPELIPSIMDAFVFPFRASAYLKILWLSFCLVAAPFAVMQMESPFGFTIITLLFVVPVAVTCRSRVMMFGITFYIFASLFVFTGMVQNINLIGWFVLLIAWFFLAYSMAFLYRVLQEGTENKQSMGPLPGFGGSDIVEEVIRPGHFLMLAIVCSYLPYLIYCFLVFDISGQFGGGFDRLGGPFAIMVFFGELMIYLSGPLEDTFFAWLLYIACWVYSLLAVAMVARMDNVMAIIPKIWLVTFFTIMGPYLGVMAFEFAVNYATGMIAENLGGFFSFGDGLFVMFLKSWLLIFASIYIAVVMFRCLGLLIAANRQRITDAFKEAGV